MFSLFQVIQGLSADTRSWHFRGAPFTFDYTTLRPLLSLSLSLSLSLQPEPLLSSLWLTLSQSLSWGVGAWVWTVWWFRFEFGGCCFKSALSGGLGWLWILVGGGLHWLWVIVCYGFFWIRVFCGGEFALVWLWLPMQWWWFCCGFFWVLLWVLAWVSFGLLVGYGKGCVRTTTRIWFNI